MVTCDFRVGYGYDVNRFAKSRKLVLGGVEIPHKVGLTGHSDADVLLHSVCDALLGAAGFEDIGHQFPNTDSRFKDISSLILLKETYKLISKKKFKVGNIDCMLSLEEPKIFKFIDEMKKNISSVIKSKNISIKATTAEGLGFVGKKEGCEATCVAILYK
jgi:2-C-methyl-D-erythritol 2,4-cyclodiphosphate synthase